MPETPPHAPHSPQEPTGAPDAYPRDGGTATGPHSAAESVPTVPELSDIDPVTREWLTRVAAEHRLAPDLLQAACETAYGSPIEETDDIPEMARALAAVLPRYEMMVLGRFLKQLPAAAKGHWPAVTPRYDGAWGVFCVACSADAQDCTACRLDRTVDWPPEMLADPAEIERQIADEQLAWHNDERFCSGNCGDEHDRTCGVTIADAAFTKAREIARGGHDA